MSFRPIDYTAAAALAADDYLLLDGSTEGTRKILAQAVLPDYVSVKTFGALGDGSGDTIAEWLTGGSRDRGYANLAAIQVDYPEANDLANTIDQVAHFRAFTIAQTTGDVVYTPPGEYIWHPSLREFNPTANFIWHLSPIATIKRQSRSQSSTWQRLFYVNTAAPIDRIEIVGGLFDGNARENPPEWGASEAVEIGDIRRNRDATTQQDRVYTCTVAGTTAGSGDGPQGKTPGIQDGTAEWDFTEDVRSWFGWEQSDIIHVNGTTHGIQHVIANNITFNDPTADGLRVTGLVYNFRASRLKTLLRERTRACVIWYQQVHSTHIESCDVSRIETEPTGDPPATGHHSVITNSTCDRLDLGGYENNDHLFYFYCNNVKTKLSTSLGGVSTKFETCDLVWRPTDGRIFGISQQFDNCDIRLHIGVDNAVVGMRSSFPSDVDGEHTWNKCRFHLFYVDLGEFADLNALNAAYPHLPYTQQFGRIAKITGGDWYIWDVATTESWVSLGATIAPTGAAIEPNTVVSTTDTVQRNKKVTECWFSPAFEDCILANRSGSLYSTRNNYAGTRTAIKALASADKRQLVWSDNDDFSRANTTFFLDNSSDPGIELFLNGQSRELKNWIRGTSGNKSRIISQRVITLESFPPSGGGFRGDRCVLRPQNLDEPVQGITEYTCTVSHPTAATWVASRWAPEITVADASAGDTTADLVAAMEGDKTYKVRIQETTALDGDTNKRIAVGTPASPELFRAEDATGTLDYWVTVDGAANAGDTLRVTVTNNALATAGAVTATVVVQ